MLANTKLFGSFNSDEERMNGLSAARGLLKFLIDD